VSPKQLIRHEYVRRVGAPDVPSSEERFAPGRYFDAECPATASVGDFVFVTGDAVGGVLQVDRVLPTSPDLTTPPAMPSLGVIVEKPSSVSCLVHGGPGIVTSTILGVVLTPNQRYFVGFNGRVAPAAPTPPVGGCALVQHIGVALSATQLLLVPDFSLVKVLG
jgi:hypothetical protein